MCYPSAFEEDIMAQFIPHELISSPASERTIYDYIKQDERTKNWIVFHSLLIEKHVHNLCGESDFVIIAPEFGCFVIEVKGGDISTSNREWFSISNDNSIHKIEDPFRQARDNCYSIQNYLHENNIPSPDFGYGVAFPKTLFKKNCPNIEYDKEMIFDLSNNGFYDYIENLSKYYKSKAKKVYQPKAFREPSSQEIASIKKALAPSFECIAPLGLKISNDKGQYLKPSEEQLRILDSFRNCKQVIIHGSSGTGKTLLAVELAKRKSDNKKKVALITYTLFLTEYLKKSVQEFENIHVFSITDYFEELCKNNKQISDDDKKNDASYFYDTLLPKKAFEYLNDNPLEFDTIIIDEAQDISPLYLLVISNILKDHLAQGNYYFFGDFTNQKVFSHCVSLNNILSYLAAMGSADPYCEKLTKNFRNSLEIQKELKKLSTISNKPNNQDPGIYRLYEDSDNELSLIEKELNILIHNEKVSPGDIMILGRKKYDSSTASKIKNFTIKPFDPCKENANFIQFSTIRRFKGLEKEVVLVIDNDDYENEQDLDVLYVAISRAKSKVIVFESLTAQIQREDREFNKNNIKE